MRRFTAVWDDFLAEKRKEAWERPPIWRYQIIQRSMLEKRTRVPSRIYDKYVTHLKAVVKTLREQNICGHRGRVLAEHDPAYTAWRYWNMSKPGGPRWRIEAYIIAGADNEFLLKTFPNTGGVETFEYFRKIFFDIESYENNDDLLDYNIMSVAYDRHINMECDLLWKAAAFRYPNLEDFSQFIHMRLRGIDKGLKQVLRELQEDSLMLHSALITQRPSELDERSMITTSLAASAMFISHDNAHKIAEIAFQEKVGKVVDHLSITLIKSDDPLPENAADIKYSDKIHHARAASKAEKIAKKKLEEAKQAEQRMRNRYQVMEAG